MKMKTPLTFDNVRYELIPEEEDEIYKNKRNTSVSPTTKSHQKESDIFNE